MMTADAGFSLPSGCRILGVCRDSGGLVWDSVGLAGGMAMDRFANMLMKLSFGFAMIHFYSTPARHLWRARLSLI